MKYLVASSKLWIPTLKEDLKSLLNEDVELITQKEQLTTEFLKNLAPDMIFFPHWSSILKPEIYSNYKCVMFHMTDLPYGRGGSPLQNLIVRGHKNTKISAFLCDGGLDTGPVYLKKELDLSGTAQEIYLRANHVIFGMIGEIVKNKLQPQKQAGDVVEFKRRKPEDGNLKNLTKLDEVYDYIRMLDADGYPQAFLESDNFKVEFSDAQLSGGEISAKVKIVKKQEI